MQPSLFDRPSATYSDEAFESWLPSSPLRKPASIEVYRDIWGSFVRWARSQPEPITMRTLNSAHLAQFLERDLVASGGTSKLSPRHSLRVLRLIERINLYLADTRELPANQSVAQFLAAHPDIRQADAGHADPLPEVLSIAETRQLILFLSEVRPRPGATRAQTHQHFSWQELRNRASVGLQLGAGISPGEVRFLQVSSVQQFSLRQRSGMKLQVPGDGQSPGRASPVAPWAAELLSHWLAVRSAHQIPGGHLFPSTRTGKPWSKPSQYLAAREVLLEAGLEQPEGGSFRLRHTFALRQLRRGCAAADLAKWLGVELEEVARYESMLADSFEVI